MKSGLFVLPFIALFIGAISTAISSAFTELAWVNYAGWSMAAGAIALWVSLDLNGFKNFFFRKGAKYGAASGLSLGLGLLIIVGAAMLASKPRFNQSFDVTKSGANSLSQQTKKLLGQIHEKKQRIEVLAFIQDEVKKTEFTDLLSLYQNAGDVFNLKIIDPQMNPTEAIANKITSANVVIVRLAEQESRLSQFTEQELTNALVKVVKQKSKKIYFTMGHGESKLRDDDPGSFKEIIVELENNRFEVQELQLLGQASIPDDADLVVIAGPRYDFRVEELNVLRKYLKSGGDLMVLESALRPVENINGLLTEFGLSYNNDLLILSPDDPRASLIGQNNAIVSKFDDFNPVSKAFSSQENVAILFANARSISVHPDNALGLKAELVGKTGLSIIQVTGVKNEADLKQLSQDRINTGEFGAIAVAAGVVKASDLAKNDNNKTQTKSDLSSAPLPESKKDETRIVAFGSAEFATNAGMQRAEHRDLFLNSVNYLLEDEDFISIRPKDATKGTLDVSSASSQLSLVFFSFIYPFFFLGGGVLVWLRRRRL